MPARHEFSGTAVCEAIYCGCRPVLPNALAYPELIPPQWRAAVLYDDFDGLVERLAQAVAEVGTAAPVAGGIASGCAGGTPSAPRQDAAMRADLRTAVARFGWPVLAPEYDACLCQLIDSPRCFRGEARA